MEKLKEDLEYEITEPTMYNVIYHNDDFTPMDFVIFSLMTIFQKSEKEAYSLTMKVHNEGSAVIGTYNEDIAYLKQENVKNLEKTILGSEILNVEVKEI